jgi:hypothetical protein
VIPDGGWVGLEPPDEAVAGASNGSIAYSAGLTVAVYRLGAGRFALNALAVRENIAASPVAERLLRNFLRWASAGREKPASDLPADFEATLDSFGYRE